jgi:hypothetical protein
VVSVKSMAALMRLCHLADDEEQDSQHRNAGGTFAHVFEDIIGSRRRSDVNAKTQWVAKLEKEHFHKIRSDYLNSFGGHPPLALGCGRAEIPSAVLHRLRRPFA